MAPAPAAVATGSQPPSRRSFYALWAAVWILSTLLLVNLWQQQRPATHPFTQEDIDAAVLRTLEPDFQLAECFGDDSTSACRFAGDCRLAGALGGDDG